MAKPKRIKRERVIVTIPNGGVIDQAYGPAAAYTPDKTYRYVNKVWAKVLNLANQPYIDLQLSDGAGNVVLDRSHSELWSGGTGVDPNKMMVELDKAIPCTGAIIKPAAFAPGLAGVAPNADIIIQFVFELVDELVETV